MGFAKFCRVLTSCFVVSKVFQVQQRISFLPSGRCRPLFCTDLRVQALKRQEEDGYLSIQNTKPDILGSNMQPIIGTHSGR